MSDFKEQQQDRIQEGKELKHEDELKDLSQMKAKELPGAEKSIMRKFSEGLSNAAHALTDKVGLTEKPIEGHEDLDKKTIKQQKKVNAEITKKGAEEGFEGAKGDTWMNRIPEDLKREIESVKITKLLRHVPREGETENKTLFGKISGGLTHFAEKIGLAEKSKDNAPKANEWEHELHKHGKKEHEGAEQKAEDLKNKASAKLDEAKENKKSAAEPSKPSFVSNMSGKLSQGVDALKEKFNTKKEEEQSEDGTDKFRTVKDGFKEDVDELKHEKRIEELGQEELASRNPFQTLTASENEESRTLGDKMKGALGEATQKVKSTFSKDTSAVDKENARTVA